MFGETSDLSDHARPQARLYGQHRQKPPRTRAVGLGTGLILTGKNGNLSVLEQTRPQVPWSKDLHRSNWTPAHGLLRAAHSVPTFPKAGGDQSSLRADAPMREQDNFRPAKSPMRNRNLSIIGLAPSSKDLSALMKKPAAGRLGASASVPALGGARALSASASAASLGGRGLAPSASMPVFMPRSPVKSGLEPERRVDQAMGGPHTRAEFVDECARPSRPPFAPAPHGRLSVAHRSTGSPPQVRPQVAGQVGGGGGRGRGGRRRRCVGAGRGALVARPVARDGAPRVARVQGAARALRRGAARAGDGLHTRPRAHAHALYFSSPALPSSRIPPTVRAPALLSGDARQPAAL